MCLIIYCDKNSNKQDPFLEEAIRKASEFNPDGMGYSIKRADNTLTINKGFFDVDSFLTSITNANLTENDELLIHLRIGNKGKVNPNMCHPFVISDDEQEILTLENNNLELPILAHNGTMSKHALTNSDKSDTYFFIKNVLTYKSVMNFLKEDEAVFDDIMQGHLQKSRLVVMFPGEESTKLLGSWYEESGFYFSKNYFEEYFPKPTLFSNYRTSDYYAGIDWDALEHQRLKSQVEDYNKKNNSTVSYKNNMIKIPALQYPRPSFEDCVGSKYVLYMGLYIPLAVGSLYSYRVEINENNYDYFVISLKTDNPKINLWTNTEYEIVDVSFSTIIIADTFTKDEYMLSHIEFYENFSYRSDKAILEFYDHYLTLVRTLNVSKTTFNKFSKQLDRAIENEKEFFFYKGQYVEVDAGVIWVEEAKKELEYLEHPHKLIF